MQVRRSVLSDVRRALQLLGAISFPLMTAFMAGSRDVEIPLDLGADLADRVTQGAVEFLTLIEIVRAARRGTSSPPG